MRKVKVAAIQMQCSTLVDENISKAKDMIREAAKNGAQIILLPELFERQYFCQERRYEFYSYAKTVEENDAVKELSPVAKELGVVLPLYFRLFLLCLSFLRFHILCLNITEPFEENNLPIFLGGAGCFYPNSIKQAIPFVLIRNIRLYRMQSIPPMNRYP